MGVPLTFARATTVSQRVYVKISHTWSISQSDYPWADTHGLVEEVYQTFEVERFGRPLSLDAKHSRDDGQEATTILDYLGEKDPDLEFMAQRMDLKQALENVDPREEKYSI